jgi:hypothetical protein
MSYIHNEIKKLGKNVLYYENYRHNLKKFIFEMVTEKPNMRIRYYKLLEEVDRITFKIETLKSIKERLEKYQEI